MKNVYVFGECMIELRVDKTLNSLENGTSPKILKQSFAGDVLNSAIYLKRTFPEINTHFVSVLGSDKFSADMLDFFKQEHIGCDLVFQTESKIPGLYAIETDGSGERTFSYWRENSAAKEVMSFIHDNEIAQLSLGDLFFFSGISLAVIKPDDRPFFWEMLEKLNHAGVKIVFDPNYRSKMWEVKAQAKEQFALAFKYAHILLPGVDDFEQLYGIDTLESVLNFCKRYQFDELVIKNGEDGVLCYIEGQVSHFYIKPVTQVVDTTSAGDSFNGVYIGARTQGYDLNHAIKLASNAAGFVIQHSGAIIEKKAYKAFISTQQI
jgi:2-dehydro-3-deoxygluconokinase